MRGRKAFGGGGFRANGRRLGGCLPGENWESGAVVSEMNCLFLKIGIPIIAECGIVDQEELEEEVK